MKSLSKTELNGCVARIVSIDVSVRRYTVEVDGGKQMRIKFDNVVLMSLATSSQTESGGLSDTLMATMDTREYKRPLLRYQTTYQK